MSNLKQEKGIWQKNSRKYFSPRRSYDKARDLFEERITLGTAATHPNEQLTHLVSLHKYWSEQGIGKDNPPPSVISRPLTKKSELACYGRQKRGDNPDVLG